MAIPADATTLDMKKIIMELTGTPYETAVPSNLETWDWNQTVNNWSANTNSSSQPSNKYSVTDWASYNHFATASFSDSKSFDFDGTNDRLEGSGSLAQQFIDGSSTRGSGSISVWVKLDSMSGNGFIFQLSPEEGTTNLVLLLWNNAAGRIRGNIKVSNVTNVVNSQAGLENDGNWHHVAFTWQYGSKTSSDNETKLYIDASLKDTDAIGNTWNDGNGPAVVGFGRNHPPGNTNPLNGHLNDIALFSDKLTASEISTIYNSGSPKDESGHSGLISYYTMENYSDNDTTLADDSSNSFTLTITNSTNIDSSDTP